MMRKKIFIAALLLGGLSVQAQEKVMNIQKKDGTCVQTRMAELKQISFLTLEEGSQGLLVKTLGGETVPVLFEANPVVTVTSSKLVIKSTGADNVEVAINDLAEIQFGDATDAITAPGGFAFVLQQGAALLRGIPEGTVPQVYDLGGRSLPTPPVHGGDLRLSRATLGPGIFIVKVGTFSTKIQL